MSKLSKADVSTSGLLPGLVKLMESWEPGHLASETEYRDSLLKFFRGAVPDDCRVEREYRHGGTTADLYLSWKGFIFNAEVFVEMKRNLNKKSSFDRLIGQLEGLEPGKRTILLVLIGNTDEALLGRLASKYSSHMRGATLVDEATMAIVVKK